MNSDLNPYMPVELDSSEVAPPLTLLGFFAWLLIVPATLILALIAYLVFLELSQRGMQVLPAAWFGHTVIALLSVVAAWKASIAGREFYRGRDLKRAGWAFSSMWLCYLLIAVVLYRMMVSLP